MEQRMAYEEACSTLYANGWYLTNCIENTDYWQRGDERIEVSVARDHALYYAIDGQNVEGTRKQIIELYAKERSMDIGPEYRENTSELTVDATITALDNLEHRVMDTLEAMRATLRRHARFERAMASEFAGLTLPIIERAIASARQRYVAECVVKIARINSAWNVGEDE